MTGNVPYSFPADLDADADAGREFTPLLRINAQSGAVGARAWSATQAVLAACARAVAVAPTAADRGDAVRVWFDLDQLSRGLVCRDGHAPAADDAAAWLRRGGWVKDGDAWLGDRADLRLVKGLGVRRVRRA